VHDFSRQFVLRKEEDEKTETGLESLANTVYDSTFLCFRLKTRDEASEEHTSLFDAS
jgi:hypothetical protein